MSIWNRNYIPVIKLEPPEGCEAEMLLKHRQTKENGGDDVIDEKISATMICPGIEGHFLVGGEVELSSETLEPKKDVWMLLLKGVSMGVRAEARKRVTAEAGQKAAHACAVNCRWSVLPAVNEAKRAAILAQAERDKTQAMEDVARQREIAAAMAELKVIGGPEVRELLGGAGAAPQAEQPSVD